MFVSAEPLARALRHDGAVTYRIALANRGGAIAGATLVAALPEGLRYRDGSATLDGREVAARVRGRRIELRRLALPASGRLVATITAEAGRGDPSDDGAVLTLRAWAVRREGGDGGEVLSNVSAPPVTREAAPAPDCPTFAGRVFVDEDGDGRAAEDEPGVAGVRLATIGGHPVTTRGNGRWHVPCALVPVSAPGAAHVVELDAATLPPGVRPASAGPLVARLGRDGATRLDIAVTRLGEVRLDFSASAFVDGDRLLPDYERALEGVVAGLAASPSRLSLVYHADGADGADEAAGGDRLRAVSADVRSLWREAGRPYPLDIVEEARDADGHPVRMRPGTGPRVTGAIGPSPARPGWRTGGTADDASFEREPVGMPRPLPRGGRLMGPAKG